MRDVRVTLPKGRDMVFGEDVNEMIHAARELLPQADRGSYVAALVIANPVGTKGRLQPVWNIKQRKVAFTRSHYGKVTFTLKAVAPAPDSLPIPVQLEMEV